MNIYRLWPRHSTFSIAACLVILATALPGIASASPTPETAEAIEYLIAGVADSGLTFIRNGKRYTGPDAAEHMRKKYEYFDEDIASAEDFIRLAASRSLISGKPYYVVLGDGTRTKTADWLGARLDEYRQRQAALQPKEVTADD